MSCTLQPAGMKSFGFQNLVDLVCGIVGGECRKVGTKYPINQHWLGSSLKGWWAGTLCTPQLVCSLKHRPQNTCSALPESAVPLPGLKLACNDDDVGLNAFINSVPGSHFEYLRPAVVEFLSWTLWGYSVSLSLSLSMYAVAHCRILAQHFQNQLYHYQG